MAISVSVLADSAFPTSSATGTTTSVTPAANSAVTIAVTQFASAAVTGFTVSGLGLTWNLAATKNNGNLRTSLYIAQCGASPSAGTITVTSNVAANGSWGYAVIQFTGHDPLWPIRQVLTTAAKTITMPPAATTPGGRAFSVWGEAANSNQGNRAGWTELVDRPGGGASLEVQWLPTGWDTATTVSNANTTAGLFFEIAEANTSQIPGFTSLTSGSSATNVSSVTTASITPAPNTMLLVAVTGINGSATKITSFTITGFGATWQQVFDTTDNSDRFQIWRAKLGATPGSGTLTITANGNVSTASIVYSVVQVNGANATAPIAASVGGWWTGALNNGVTLNNTSAVNTNDRCIAFFASEIAETASPAYSTWFEISDTVGTNMALETQYRPDAWDRTAGVNYATSTTMLAAIIEIAYDPGALPTQISAGDTNTGVTEAATLNIITADTATGAGQAAGIAATLSAADLFAPTVEAISIHLAKSSGDFAAFAESIVLSKQTPTDNDTGQGAETARVAVAAAEAGALADAAVAVNLSVTSVQDDEPAHALDDQDLTELLHAAADDDPLTASDDAVLYQSTRVFTAADTGTLVDAGTVGPPSQVSGDSASLTDAASVQPHGVDAAQFAESTVVTDATYAYPSDDQAVTTADAATVALADDELSTLVDAQSLYANVRVVSDNDPATIGDNSLVALTSGDSATGTAQTASVFVTFFPVSDNDDCTLRDGLDMLIKTNPVGPAQLTLNDSADFHETASVSVSTPAGAGPIRFMGAGIEMVTAKVINVAAPTAPTDGAPRSYADTLLNPFVAEQLRTTDATVTTEAVTDTVTFTAIAGARYKATFQTHLSGAAGDLPVIRLRLTDTTGTVIHALRTGLPATGAPTPVTLVRTFTATADGPATVVVTGTADTVALTLLADATTRPAYLLVETC